MLVYCFRCAYYIPQGAHPRRFHHQVTHTNYKAYFLNGVHFSFIFSFNLGRFYE
jgi:hypothetical protein